MTSPPKLVHCVFISWANTQNLRGWKRWVLVEKLMPVKTSYMLIWVVNKFAKFYAKRLKRSENISKSFREATFLKQPVLLPTTTRMTLLTIFYVHVAGWENDRFKKVRIRIGQIFRNYIVTLDVVVVSTESLREEHVFRMNANSDCEKAVERSEYPAVCLYNHCSPWRHSYLHMQPYIGLQVYTIRHPSYWKVDKTHECTI